MVSWSQIIYGRRTVSNFSENSTILLGGPAAENGTLNLSFRRHRTVSGEVKVLIKSAGITGMSLTAPDRIAGYCCHTKFH